jgi:uncharacterized membrane protein YfcA
VLVGLAGGFLAGLVGVGGGIIYGPALFYFFRASGIEDPILTPLTLGSSLLCVGATAFSGAWAQRGAQTIVWRVAGISGLAAAASVVLTGRFVTTQPWYDATLFQLVLGTVLVYVVLRLFIRKKRLDDEALVANRDGMRDGWPMLVVLGAGAGVLVAAAGVGGGVVFVPLYANLVRMPLKAASATSLGSILIVSTAGVLTYLVLGLGSAVPAGAIGYAAGRPGHPHRALRRVDGAPRRDEMGALHLRRARGGRGRSAVLGRFRALTTSRHRFEEP